MKKKKILILVLCCIAVLFIASMGIVCVVKHAQDNTKVEIEEFPSKEDDEEREEPPKTEEAEKNQENDKTWKKALKLVEKDVEKAFPVFEELAKEDSDAKYIVGEMYLQGIGIAQDMEKATTYISQAYEDGNVHACEIYGKMAYLGEGVILQDYEEALKAFSVTARKSGEAACALGTMYMYGMGVNPDYDMANAYLVEALANGYEMAADYQTKIQQRLTGVTPPLAASTKELRDGRSAAEDETGKAVLEYIEQLKAGEQYTRFKEELVALQASNPDLASFIAIYGKENWLFLKNPNDGNSYHDYLGDNAYTEEEMASIAVALMEQKQKVEEAGSKFVLMLLPNKEIIYADKMPSFIQRVSEITRTDKLVEYLRANTELTIIYPKETYLAKKDQYQLYYDTDTHYNMQGTFLAISELMNGVYGKQISIENTLFEERLNNYCGDIGNMIGRADRYAQDTVYFLPETSVPEEDKVEDSIILIGDSFSEFLNMEAKYYFKGGVNHVMIMNYGYNFYTAAQETVTQGAADIVVWECAERYLDRLKNK